MRDKVKEPIWSIERMCPVCADALKHTHEVRELVDRYPRSGMCKLCQNFRTLGRYEVDMNQRPLEV